MSKPVKASSSWNGLIAVLAAIGLAIAGIWFGLTHIADAAGKTEARIRSEFIQPYLAALQRGDSRTIWADLTTEAYRAKYSPDKHAAAVALVIARFGRPESIEITKVTSTHEPGRSFQQVRGYWNWERGPRFLRVLQLVDVPETGYRLDGATLGRDAGNVPADIPANPW